VSKEVKECDHVWERDGASCMYNSGNIHCTKCDYYIFSVEEAKEMLNKLQNRLLIKDKE
jgi:hypothetical protein